MHTPANQVKPHRPRLSGRIPIPTGKLECIYYLAMGIPLIGPAFGLEIRYSGVVTIAVFVACVLRVQPLTKAVFAPIALLAACIISFLPIQIVVHRESIFGEGILHYISWLVNLMIVRSLCLRRGFLFRFPLVMLAICVIAILFVGYTVGEDARAVADTEVEGELRTPAAFAQWFGFLAIYFVVVGLNGHRRLFRLCAWFVAVGCVLLLALSVERGPLLGVALASVIVFRQQLKRAFIPVLVLVSLIGIISLGGVFDAVFSNYQERAFEETGREVLWPAAIERIFSAPFVTLFGVGESNILYQLGYNKFSPPHNAFLHIFLASGVVPFAFFVAFWIQAAWRSAHAKGQDDAPFRLPYLVYSFVLYMVVDIVTSPWALLALCVAAGPAAVPGKQGLRFVRVGHKIWLGRFPEPKSPKPTTAAPSQ